MRHLTTTLLALAAASSTTLAARKTPADAVLLSNIKTLTLHNGRQTTARRGPAVPQLECVGGNARGLHSVDVMRCTNAGADYDAEDVQWTCQASLPSEFKLGSTEVVCEGYASPEDPYVLKGSCGVEYRLILTEAGERRFGERVDDGGEDDYYGGGSGYESGKKGGVGGMLFTVVFWAIFLGEKLVFELAFWYDQANAITGIIGLIAKSIWTGGGGGNNAVGRRPGNGWGGGYGGGGGGDEDGHDDPPPPYDQSPPYSKQNSRSTPSSSSWRPGLFSGAAAGAAAGYAMGSRNNNRGPSAGQAGPSNWFGNSNNGAGSSRSSFGGGGGSSASPPSSGGARYESTGFGGSRRR
jgi:hypothetical protein